MFNFTTKNEAIRFLLSCLLYKIVNGDFDSESQEDDENNSICWTLKENGGEAHYLKLLYGRSLDLPLARALFTQTINLYVTDVMMQETIFERITYGGFRPNSSSEIYSLFLRREFFSLARKFCELRTLDQLLGWPKNMASAFFPYMFGQPLATTVKVLEQTLGLHGWPASLLPELARLQCHYSWRALKARNALPVRLIPVPFCLITYDKQTVAANRAEVSFLKELLTKAAGAAIKDEFQFSLSKNHDLVVKYRHKILGQVFLRGRQHRMEFTVGGKSFSFENLSLVQCKKWLLIWLGQIKIPTSVIDLMDEALVDGNGYEIKLLGEIENQRVFMQKPKQWQESINTPAFILLDKCGNARQATPNETRQIIQSYFQEIS